ncbi:MAG: hypothetical protein HXS48_10855 [Theionarchaea archaeon]|nr:hypothetical protein [Theionarchaea archaeon]
MFAKLISSGKTAMIPFPKYCTNNGHQPALACYNTGHWPVSEVCEYGTLPW